MSKKYGPYIVNAPEINKEKKTYNIRINESKKEYILDIRLNNNLDFSLKENIDIEIKYAKSYSYEDFKNLSRVFAIYEDLNGIYKYLIDMLDKKKIILQKELFTNKMYLSFSFKIPGVEKPEEIKIFLDNISQNKNKDEEIVTIKEELIQLKKEIKELKEENTFLKSKIEKKEENNDSKENLEEIINLLIEEKLNEKLKNINQNQNQNNELQNVNELINIISQDHQDEIKQIKKDIDGLNKKINDIKEKNRENGKDNSKESSEEIENLHTIINEIHKMDEEENQKLYKRINDLSFKINSYETIIQDTKRLQKEEIESLRTIVNQCNTNNQEEIESLRMIVNEIINNKDIKLKIGDILIDKKNYLSKFINIIKKDIDAYKNKDINGKLLYTTSWDGGNCQNCHLKCNNIPNTLSLITTTKGIKFGFFRNIPINGNGPWLKDNNSFFISFDKGKIYQVKKDKCVVKFDNNSFLNIIDLNLTGNILNSRHSCPSLDDLSLDFQGFTQEFELNCGEKEFYIKKFEIFYIEFKN